jgi:anti-sigma B factor antagonist/stage II sporulation protein AA (anti-sigma F factor antagonist)
MEIITRYIANVLLIRVAGRIDHTTAQAFENALLPQLDGCTGEHKKVLLEVSDIVYMSSAGLRVLMMAAKQCRQQDGDIAIAALSPLLQEVFAISRFDRVFTIFPTRPFPLPRHWCMVEHSRIMRTTDLATITIPAHLESVARGMAFVVAWVTAAGLPPRRVSAIEIAAEEVLVNICRHAGVDRTGMVEIRCMRDGTHRLRIEFIDTGRPFDMLTLPAPDLLAEVNQRPVGGLGVWLIRTLVDTVTYRREGCRNILQLAVQLPQ